MLCNSLCFSEEEFGKSNVSQTSCYKEQYQDQTVCRNLLPIKVLWIHI